MQYASDFAWGVYAKAEQYTVVKTAIDLTKPVTNFVAPVVNPVAGTVVSVTDPWVDTIDSIVSGAWYSIWGRPSHNSAERKELVLDPKYKDKKWKEIVVLSLNDAPANGKTLAVSRAKVTKDDISAAIAASAKSACVYDNDINAVQFKLLWEKIKELSQELDNDSKSPNPDGDDCALVTLRIKDTDQQFPVVQDKLYGLFKAALDLDLSTDVVHIRQPSVEKNTWKPPASPSGASKSAAANKPPSSPAARPKTH